jgi:hypothetical protein
MPLRRWKNPNVAWKSFHNFWVAKIAEQLNEVLPAGFQARPTELAVGIEPDVLTFQIRSDTETPAPPNPTPELMEPTRTAVLSPPMESPFVGIYSDYDATHLVAAIDIISPTNKRSKPDRQEFVNKAILLLREGVHLMVIDVLSDPPRPIRRDILHRLEMEEETKEDRLWIASYCSLLKEDPQPHVTVREWARDVAVGDTLPSLPLFLIADELWVMLDLEATYRETIRAGRYKPL